MNERFTTEFNIIKTEYASLRDRPDNYVLNGVVTKSIFYKNPSLILQDSDLNQIIVDGTGDNGIDCILTDFNSDHHDIVFIQCKCYESIQLENVKTAISKLVAAYRALKEERYEQFNERVYSQYQRCLDEMEEGAKIKFVFATTSPRNRTQTRSIINHFNSIKGDLPIVMDEDCIFFESELIDAINDARSVRSTISFDKLMIDKPRNFVSYFNDQNVEMGIAVNISARSLKNLYARYRNELLSQNLRFFVKNRLIDKDVDDTINNAPDSFWFKNNGISIICDSYEVSGRELKLSNFSIINGGQTTRKIFDNQNVFESSDFYLMCRIIKNPYENASEKQQFIYEISKATNSQKAIKPSDLRANNREQKLFESSLLSAGVFYKTKRGMIVPNSFREKYKNCDLSKAGKVALAGFFLMPGTSRNKPSVIYDDAKDFYDTIFKKDENRDRNAKYIADLLYIDYHFDSKFIKQFRANNQENNKSLLRFAGNSRTLVSAFVGFFCKYYNNEFDNSDLNYLSNANSENADSIIKIQKCLKKAENVSRIFNNRNLSLDDRDALLDKIFNFAIVRGFTEYTSYVRNNNNQDAVDETNWLKRDGTFYQILKGIISTRGIDPWPDEFERLFIETED